MKARAESLRMAWVVLAGAAAAITFVAAAALGQDQAGSVSQGERLFNDQGCYGCHTVGKTGTAIAPDLSHVGTKYSQASLLDWLREPQAQKPRAHMPKIEMPEGEARALAAYLASLK